MALLEREAALGDLGAALHQAVHEHGRIALVSGEAGIGKTSLVEHFAREREARVRIFWAGCDALFTPRPLGPVHDIAAQAGGTLADSLSRALGGGTVFGALLAELQR